MWWAPWLLRCCVADSPPLVLNPVVFFVEADMRPQQSHRKDLTWGSAWRQFDILALVRRGSGTRRLLQIELVEKHSAERLRHCYHTTKAGREGQLCSVKSTTASTTVALSQRYFQDHQSVKIFNLEELIPDLLENVSTIDHVIHLFSQKYSVLRLKPQCDTVAMDYIHDFERLLPHMSIVFLLNFIYRSPQPATLAQLQTVFAKLCCLEALTWRHQFQLELVLVLVTPFIVTVMNNEGQRTFSCRCQKYVRSILEKGKLIGRCDDEHLETSRALSLIVNWCFSANSNIQTIGTIGTDSSFDSLECDSPEVINEQLGNFTRSNKFTTNTSLAQICSCLQQGSLNTEQQLYVQFLELIEQNKFLFTLDYEHFLFSQLQDHSMPNDLRDFVCRLHECMQSGRKGFISRLCGVEQMPMPTLNDQPVLVDKLCCSFSLSDNICVSVSSALDEIKVWHLSRFQCLRTIRDVKKPRNIRMVNVRKL